MDEKSLQDRIARLRATYLSGKTKPLAWRQSQLLAMQRMFNERGAEFEAAMKLDVHKSAFECYATEIGFTLREINHALAHLEHWMKPRRLPPRSFCCPPPAR